jgi:hypothetical protein
LDEIACVAGNTGRLSTVADHAGAVPITKLEITTAAAVLKLTIFVSSFFLRAIVGSHKEGRYKRANKWFKRMEPALLFASGALFAEERLKAEDAVTRDFGRTCLNGRRTGS